MGTENSPPLFCPLVALMTPTATKGRRCLREKCAWWDGLNERCIIASIYDQLFQMTEWLSEINRDMPKDR